MKQYEYGFVLPIIIVVILFSTIGAFILIKNQSNSFKNYGEVHENDGEITKTSQNNTVTFSSESAQIKNSESSNQINKIARASASPKISPTPTPTPQPRPVTAKGFAFYDSNNDGKFNEGENPLQYMMFYFYDSIKPNEQISTIHTEVDGKFTLTLNVVGNMIAKPMQWLSYEPKSGSATFSSTNSETVNFAFRPTSDTGGGKGGIIEGDFIQDSNQNGQAESGEEQVFFYKIYLNDEAGNFYPSQEGDTGGHFKFINLPLNKTFTLRLSTDPTLYKIYQDKYTFTPTNQNPTISNIKIPVYKY